MASWKEIEGFRKDPKAARLLAKSLLKTGSGVLTEWEADFLDSMSRRYQDWELTTRQAEKLLQIRDGLETVTVFRGFSVEKLLAACHLARLDLSEDDEAWIVRIRAKSGNSIPRCNVGRLMRCARQLHLVEPEPVD
jgi:hypothetical protein